MGAALVLISLLFLLVSAYAYGGVAVKRVLCGEGLAEAIVYARAPGSSVSLQGATLSRPRCHPYR